MTSTDPTAPETHLPITHAHEPSPPRPRQLLFSDDLRVHCLRAVGLVAIVLGAGAILSSSRWMLTAYYWDMPRAWLFGPLTALAHMALGAYLLIGATGVLRNRPHGYRYLRIYARLGIAYAFLVAVVSPLVAAYRFPMGIPMWIVEAPSILCHNIALPLLVLLLLRHPAVKEASQNSPPGFEVIRPAIPQSADSTPPLPVQKL